MKDTKIWKSEPAYEQQKSILNDKMKKISNRWKHESSVALWERIIHASMILFGLTAEPVLKLVKERII